jgi:hypothetical protein
MTRLPNPGSDDGVWGQVLNDFLGVAHDADGTLKPSALNAVGVELKAQKGAANGYAGLNGNAVVPAAQLGTGSAGAGTYLRGDGAWAAAPGAPVTSVNTQTGAVSLTAANVGAYSTAQIDTALRAVDAIVIYDSGSSAYPLRSTVTADSLRPVRWRGPVAPTIGGGYAVDGLDVWEMTP